MQVKIIDSMVADDNTQYASIAKYVGGIYEAYRPKNGGVKFYPNKNKKLSLYLLDGEYEIVSE